jgi:hypothetical protein
MALKAIIGLVLLAAVGGGVYVATRPSSEPAPEAAVASNEESAEGKFADLLARVGSWKCDAKATHEEGASEGTVFMDGGKVRGDFVATLSGQTVNTSFVSMDGYIYTWSDMLPQGMKVKMDAAAGTAGGQGIDPSTPVEYTCEVWIADQEKFALPSEIEFFEIGTQGMGGFNAQLPR